MNDLGTLPLETERLLLRRITLDDANAMYENWASDPLVANGAGWPAHKKPEDTAALVAKWTEAYAKPHTYHWVAVEKSSSKPFGTISGMRVSEKNETCELGYCFGQAWWNKGYATEAAVAVLRFLLFEAGFFLVECMYRSNNPASGRVMEKAGMRFEAVLKNRRRDEETGLRSDLIVYTATRDTWERAL